MAFSTAPRTPAAAALGRERKLERMRMLLGLLGNPQARFQSILVAGTKGKGSMAATLAAILSAAGYRVGRYTQPHLYSYRERTWACGRSIAPEELVAIYRAMEPAIELIARCSGEVGPLTTFDVGTALSLAYFAERTVDVAVLEVGVGGAHDATNAVDPMLALIGPIGLDHVATLGPDLGAIAREKAGVARAGIEVIVGRQEPEALAVVEEAVRCVGGRAQVLGRDFSVEPVGGCRDRFSVTGPVGRLEDLMIPLEGTFQRDNAAVAVAAAWALAERGWHISDGAIRRGLETVEWPGRFQTVVLDPLTIVDGAHNASAARALASTLTSCLGMRRVSLVLGMSEDKEARAFIAELSPLVDRAVVTRARHARAMEPVRLQAALQEAGVPAEVAPTPAAAVCHAWSALPDDGVVLVTGSLFLVGDVLEWLLDVAERGPEGTGCRT